MGGIDFNNTPVTNWVYQGITDPLKHRVGDTVKVKSLEWYNNLKDKRFHMEHNHCVYFTKEMSQFCGKEVTISRVDSEDKTYHIKEFKNYWVDGMFE